MSIGTIYPHPPINPNSWLIEKSAKVNAVVTATRSVTKTEAIPASNSHSVTTPVERSAGSPENKRVPDDKPVKLTSGVFSPRCEITMKENKMGFSNGTYYSPDWTGKELTLSSRILDEKEPPQIMQETTSSSTWQEHRDETLLVSRTNCYKNKSKNAFMKKAIENYLLAVAESEKKMKDYCQAAREERLAVFKSIRSDRSKGVNSSESANIVKSSSEIKVGEKVSVSQAALTGSDGIMVHGNESDSSTQNDRRRTYPKWSEASSQEIRNSNEDLDIDSGISSLVLEEEQLVSELTDEEVFEHDQNIMDNSASVAQISLSEKSSVDDLNEVTKESANIDAASEKITYERYAALWDGVNSSYDEKTMKSIMEFLKDSDSDSDRQTDDDFPVETINHHFSSDDEDVATLSRRDQESLNLKEYEVYVPENFYTVGKSNSFSHLRVMPTLYEVDNESDSNDQINARSGNEVSQFNTIPKSLMKFNDDEQFTNNTPRIIRRQEIFSPELIQKIVDMPMKLKGMEDQLLSELQYIERNNKLQIWNENDDDNFSETSPVIYQDEQIDSFINEPALKGKENNSASLTHAEQIPFGTGNNVPIFV